MYPFYAKFDESDLYWSSDLHINHKNMCRGVSAWPDLEKTRDFKDVQQMNEAILDSINYTVPKNKALILIGDILFGDKTLLPVYRDRILCENVFYIYGNHCKFIRCNEDYQQLFQYCDDYLEVFVGRKLICNFHYPMKVWNESHRKSWACTGHCHGSLPYEEHELGVDVGWDVWRKPLTFRDLKEHMSHKKWKAVDHHNERTT